MLRVLLRISRVCERVKSVSLMSNLKFLTLSPTLKSHTSLNNERQRVRESKKKERELLNLSYPLLSTNAACFIKYIVCM